jgi:hypothetical protein
MGNTEETRAIGQRGFLIRSGVDDQLFSVCITRGPRIILLQIMKSPTTIAKL